MYKHVHTLNEAQAHYQTGEKLLKQSKYSSALEAFTKAKSIFETHQDWISFLACHYHIGRLYIQNSNPQKAVEILLKGIELGKEKELEKTEAMGNLYLEISSAHIALGELSQVEAYQLTAETIFKSVPNLSENAMGSCYLYMGVFHNIKGDLGKALQYFHKSLKIFQDLENNEDNHASMSSCLLYAGDCLRVLGKYEEAMSYYQKNLQINLSLYDEKSYQVNSSYLRLGVNHTRMGNFSKGLEYYQRALTIGEELFGHYHIKNCFVHTDIGLNYKRRGLSYLDKARQHFEIALDIGQKILGKYHVRIALNHFFIADTFIEEEEYLLALTVNQQIFATLDEVFDLGTTSLNEKVLEYLEAAKDHGFLLDILKQKAKILFQLYLQKRQDVEALQNSFETYSLISDAIGILYGSTASERTKLRVRAESKYIYEQIIQIGLLLQSYFPDNTHLSHKAFEAAEKSKANLLFTDLQTTHAKWSAQIPDELLQKEQRLHREWKILEKKIKIMETEEKAVDKKKIGEWKSQLFDIQRAYEKLVQKLERNFPKYLQLKRQLSIAGVEDLQNMLHRKQDFILVSYFVGAEKLYIFVLGQQHFEIVETDYPNDLTGKVKSFVRAINFSLQEECIELAYVLYKQLIAPIAPILQKISPSIPSNKESLTSISTPTLLIIPDGILSQLPFEALITQATDSYTPVSTRLPYFLLDYNILYHYSASLWKYGLNQSRKMKWSENSFVGFAPVYADKLLKDLEQKETLAGAYHEDSTRSVNIRGKVFQELLYSEREIRQIQQLFEHHGCKAQAFVHEQASVEQFKKVANQYKYIHISAHSFPNPKEVNLSGIVFSPDITCLHSASAEMEEIDSIFYLQDAYLLDLQADLVVLSCCETGIGKLAEGEGMLAMNRGFLAAGANNVIYTLFKVYDEVSSVLTKKMFEHILEGSPQKLGGKPYSTALRLAKLEMLEGETAMPKFWAGYVLIGVG